MDKKKFDIQSFVYEYKTKHKEGFTPTELENIKKEFPFEINEEKFNNAMMGNTCMMIDDVIITYHCDVVTALRCGSENRDMRWWEWD